ncbi:hypothetical protein AB0M46_48465 [Dactylosporangium sp. NPDC051485]|uniref:hypothetical protein n=1 Tax=Dactylosporangium sp. NPDC051485 TaxID=3154846 RepID=UPI00343B8D9C
MNATVLRIVPARSDWQPTEEAADAAAEALRAMCPSADEFAIVRYAETTLIDESGSARFELWVRNPARPRLSPAELARLATLLGADLRQLLVPR